MKFLDNPSRCGCCGGLAEDYWLLDRIWREAASEHPVLCLNCLRLHLRRTLTIVRQRVRRGMTLPMYSESYRVVDSEGDDE
jgi:hypothetical protein